MVGVPQSVEELRVMSSLLELLEKIFEEPR
jgi:hypothetical protein